MEFPSSLHPDESDRAGRMLAAGDVRVTVTNADTDEHVTVRFKCILDNRETNGQRPEPSQNKNWVRAPLARATHIFVEVPSAGGTYPDKIGTFYPRTGRFFPDAAADPIRVRAAILSAHWLEGGYDGLEEVLGEDVAAKYDLQEESYCGKCGRQLTDPVSIERGIGPECYGVNTGAHHQVKVTGPVADLTDDDWSRIQGHKFTVVQVLDIISDMSEADQRKIRNELKMWHSQGRSSGLFDR